MKKILFVMVMACVSMTASAQAFIEGKIGLGYQKTEDVDGIFSFGIAPTIGFDFNDKFAVGVQLSEELNIQGDYRVNTVGLTPFARYTYAELGKAKLYVDGGVIFGFTNIKNLDGTGFTWGFAITPSISYPLTDSVSLVGSLGSLSWQNSSFDGASSSSFNISLLRQASIGLRFDI